MVIANLLPIVPVKWFWKWVGLWRS